MDFITLFLIAVGLAMDAFSVAISDGIVLKKVKISDALKIGLFFGVFQFGMLFVGNLLGGTFAKYIEACDHWIAFFLLVILGGKMIYEAFHENEMIEEAEKNPMEFKTLTVLAVATSIDALAAVAFLFSFAGIYIGSKCGNLFGNKSEIVGGIVLIGIGIKILAESLFF